MSPTGRRPGWYLQPPVTQWEGAQLEAASACGASSILCSMTAVAEWVDPCLQPSSQQPAVSNSQQAGVLSQGRTHHTQAHGHLCQSLRGWLLMVLPRRPTTVPQQSVWCQLQWLGLLVGLLGNFISDSTGVWLTLGSVQGQPGASAAAAEAGDGQSGDWNTLRATKQASRPGRMQPHAQCMLAATYVCAAVCLQRQQQQSDQGPRKFRSTGLLGNSHLWFADTCCVLCCAVPCAVRLLARCRPLVSSTRSAPTPRSLSSRLRWAQCRGGASRGVGGGCGVRGHWRGARVQEHEAC